MEVVNLLPYNIHTKNLVVINLILCMGPKETCNHIHQMIENYPSFKQNRQILIKVFHDIVKVHTDLETIDQNICS